MSYAPVSISALLLQMVEANGDTMHLWESQGEAKSDYKFRIYGDFRKAGTLSADASRRIITEAIKLPRVSASCEKAIPAVMLTGGQGDDRWTVLGSTLGIDDTKVARFTLMHAGKVRWISVSVLTPNKGGHWLDGVPAAGSA